MMVKLIIQHPIQRLLVKRTGSGSTVAYMLVIEKSTVDLLGQPAWFACQELRLRVSWLDERLEVHKLGRYDGDEPGPWCLLIEAFKSEIADAISEIDIDARRSAPMDIAQGSINRAGPYR